jgi:hypothetical protein
LLVKIQLAKNLKDPWYAKRFLGATAWWVYGKAREKLEEELISAATL